MLLLIVECHFLPSRRRTCIFLLAVFAATLGAMLHGYNLVDSAVLFVVAGLSLTQRRLLLALVSSRPGMKSVKIIPLPNAVVAVTMSCSSAAFSKVKISGNSCLSQGSAPECGRLGSSSSRTEMPGFAWLRLGILPWSQILRALCTSSADAEAPAPEWNLCTPRERAIGWLSSRIADVDHRRSRSGPLHLMGSRRWSHLS
jgi:hypothetical protein